MQRLFSQTTMVRTFFISFLCAGVLALGIVWFLSAQDKLCLVRTHGEPKSFYGTDTNRFLSEIHRVRSEARTSLTSLFDRETGFFIYEIRPDGMILNTNNDIRQLLASRILAQDAVGDADILALHKGNLNAIMSQWYREEGGLGYVFVDEKSKLGANALLLRALVSSPLFSLYTEEASALVRGIASIQHLDGSFKAWFREPSYAYDEEYLLTFYSGEAILALLEYYEKTGNSEAYGMAVRAQDFYIGEYVTRMDENYYPAYVPWHTLSLSLLYSITEDKRYADALMMLTDKLLDIQDTEKFIGRFYNPVYPHYGSPHASSDAVYTEGLAEAYYVAQRSGDTVREELYKDALIRAFHNLEGLQFKAQWYRIFDDRETAERLTGGFITNACKKNVRIDSTAHAIDAFDRMTRALME